MDWKRLVGVIVAIGILGIGAVAYAASYNSPAEIVADLTGESVESVMAERATGKTYGAMAADAGLSMEFKEKMLALKKDQLQQRVQAGQMTEEEAAGIYERLQNAQANCPAAGGTGQQQHGGFGRGGMGRMGRGGQQGLQGQRNGLCPGFGAGGK